MGGLCSGPHNRNVAHSKKFMNQNKIDGVQSEERTRLGLPAVNIPIHFTSHLPVSFEVKILRQRFSKDFAPAQENPLIPFFHAQLSGPTPAPIFRRALTMRWADPVEVMLNADRLEAVLKNIEKKKKALTR